MSISPTATARCTATCRPGAGWSISRPTSRRSGKLDIPEATISIELEYSPEPDEDRGVGRRGLRADGRPDASGGAATVSRAGAILAPARCWPRADPAGRLAGAGDGPGGDPAVTGWSGHSVERAGRRRRTRWPAWKDRARRRTSGGAGPGGYGRGARRESRPVAAGPAGDRDDRPGPGDGGHRAAVGRPAGGRAVPHRHLGPRAAAGAHRRWRRSCRCRCMRRPGSAPWATPAGCRRWACGRSWSAGSGPRSCTRWPRCPGSSCWRASGSARSSPSWRNRPCWNSARGASLCRVTLRRAVGAIAAAALAVAVLTAGDMTVTDLLQVRTYAEEAYVQFILGRAWRMRRSSHCRRWSCSGSRSCWPAGRCRGSTRRGWRPPPRRPGPGGSAAGECPGRGARSSWSATLVAFPLVCADLARGPSRRAGERSGRPPAWSLVGFDRHAALCRRRDRASRCRRVSSGRRSPRRWRPSLAYRTVPGPAGARGPGGWIMLGDDGPRPGDAGADRWPGPDPGLSQLAGAL